VELAIRQGKGGFEDALYAELLAPLDLFAVASPSLVAGRDMHGPEACTGLRLIEDGHRHWRAAGLTGGAQVLQLNQTAMAIDAAIGGQGVALAPRILVEDPVDAGLLRILWQQNGEGGYFLVWLRSRPLGEGAQAMVTWLRAEMGQNQSAGWDRKL
jgi:LysR family glycine cleavage system transcriptional activator